MRGTIFGRQADFHKVDSRILCSTILYKHSLNFSA